VHCHWLSLRLHHPAAARCSQQAAADFFPHHRNVARRIDTNAHDTLADSDYRDFDLIANLNTLAHLA
jgi:hypothetical protein